MHLRSAAIPLLFATLAARVGAQQVFVVAPSPGPGVFSTTIQPAVNAAVDGDIVLVKAGTYGGFNMFHKGITVSAEAGAAVSTTAIHVETPPAGTRLVLRGLTVVPSAGATTAAVTLNGCPGPVWIERCTLQGVGGAFKGSNGIGLHALNSPSVVVESSVVRGAQTFMVPTIAGASAIEAYNSKLYVHDCEIVGGDANPSPFGLASPGGAGISTYRSLLYVSGSTVHGGNGASVVAPGVNGGNGGPGLSMFGDSFALATTFTGGAGGAGGLGGSAGSPGLPVQIQAGTFTTLPGSARHFATESPVRELAVSNFSLTGAPGEIAAVIASPEPDLGFLFTPFSGPLLVSGTNALALQLAVLPPSGTATVPISIPSLGASSQGGIVFIQSFFFDSPLTTVSLGPVSALVVLDQTL